MTRLKEWMRRRLRKWLGISDLREYVSSNRRYCDELWQHISPRDKVIKELESKLDTHISVIYQSLDYKMDKI